MVYRILFLIFLLTAGSISAQPEQCDPLLVDEEQRQLELCYRYSNRFGYDIESINNPKLFETVKEWLGTGYCYAGNTKHGVDCSGFVSALYEQVFNCVLEGSSKDMFDQSMQLRESQLLEGDLVFFRISKKRVSHVGIYLGQNRFAHASLREGVVISNLDEPYYRKYFYKGGRIIGH